MKKEELIQHLVQVKSTVKEPDFQKPEKTRCVNNEELIKHLAGMKSVVKELDFQKSEKTCGMNNEELKKHLADMKKSISANHAFQPHDDLTIAPMKGVNILIAEKSTFTSVILRKALETLGSHVLASVRNGEEAIASYRQLKPDVMLVAQDLEGSTGIDVTRTITSEDPAAVVVMLIDEAEDMPNSVIDAVRAGAKSYVRKPLSETQMAQCISGALQKTHATLN